MMQISAELLEKVVAEVLAEMGAGKSPAVKEADVCASNFTLQEVGPAQRGIDPKEVVLAISPAFGTSFKKTIVDVPLADVVRQVFAGIEEEGLKCRVIRVYHTADVAFMAHQAAKLSGSGIGIGILSRGTSVIHQRDLNPLSNLELFPQAPLLDAPTFRMIGKNAAKYAKGENPVPVATRNDPMARPRYQGLAALLHNKEASFQDKAKAPQELKVTFG